MMGLSHIHRSRLTAADIKNCSKFRQRAENFEKVSNAKIWGFPIISRFFEMVNHNKKFTTSFDPRDLANFLKAIKFL